MAIIKWGTKFKQAVKLKMARGATPEQIKASFCKMVDGLDTPDTKLAAARAEIRRLRKLVGKEKPTGMHLVHGRPKPVEK